MNSMLGSVVIPAHNEATVIRRCLDALFKGFGPGELDVVVACNGCSDSTAAAVRSSGHPVAVIELDIASKAEALRIAERAVRAFPRVYLDADVVLPGPSARRVLERLQSGPALAARPPISYSTEQSLGLVRRYYRARSRVPAVMASLWGAGAYGLAEAGRARFETYPDLIGDDLYVDQHFSPEEIEIVDCEPVIVIAPRRVSDLRPSSTVRATAADVGRLGLGGPGAALDAATYATLAVSARLACKLTKAPAWERDESSRVN
jgi:hypothetical protein